MYITNRPLVGARGVFNNVVYTSSRTLHSSQIVASKRWGPRKVQDGKDQSPSTDDHKTGLVGSQGGLVSGMSSCLKIFGGGRVIHRVSLNTPSRSVLAKQAVGIATGVPGSGPFATSAPRFEFPKTWSAPQPGQTLSQQLANIIQRHTPQKTQGENLAAKASQQLQLLRQQRQQQHQSQEQHPLSQFRFPTLSSSSYNNPEVRERELSAKFLFLISNYCRRMNHVACEETLKNMKLEGLSLPAKAYEDVLRMYKELSFKDKYLSTLLSAINEQVMIPVNWFNRGIIWCNSALEAIPIYTFVLTNKIGNSDTLRTMAHMYIQEKNTSGVFNVVQDSKTSKIQFGVTSVLEVMSFLMTKEKTLFDQFWNGVHEIIDANTKTFNSLIQTLIESDLYELMPFVQEKMKSLQVFPDSKTFDPLFRLYIREHNLPKLCKTIQAMENKELQISYTNCVTALETLSSVKYNAEHTEPIKIILKHLDRTGLAASLWVYNSLLRKYARAKKVSELNDIMWHMEENKVLPDIETFNILLSMRAAENNVSAVNKIFQNLIQSGVTPNERTFQLVASMCNTFQEAGLLMTAGKSLVMQAGIPLSVSMINQLIRTVAQEGNLKMTERIIMMMEEKGIQPNLDTFDAMLLTMSVQRNRDGARTVLEMMRMRGIALPSRWVDLVRDFHFDLSRYK